MSSLEEFFQAIGFSPVVPVIMIFPLPCGCVVELSSVEPIIIDQEDDSLDLIECPWCAATYDRIELSDWLNSDATPPVAHCRPPKPLLRVGNDAVEVVDRCGCGAPIVRLHGGKPFHLPVTKDVTELKN